MLTKASKILQNYYGFKSFKKGQEQTITSILTNRDTFTIMPTGGGKSLCYQIPALLLSGITLVISPLISLMKDQVDALNNNGIAATFINSSLDFSEIRVRINQIKNNQFKLLYVAPERLEAPEFRLLLHQLNISLLAVDEAHCVSHWGHDFRPSYRVIKTLIPELEPRPIVAAFTATATKEVKIDIINLLGLKEPDIYVTGFDRENLYYSVVKDRNKKDFILEYIGKHLTEAGIIYAGTRNEVDSLYQLLQEKGFKVGRYHAGLTPVERQQTQEDFTYDKLNVIIATNAFGMGIDKSNIRFVIHHNMPKNIEAYYQEAGRAGRDGEPAECILLFSPGDIQLQKFLIEQGSNQESRKEIRYQKLQEMINYCHTAECLRKYILRYFGESNLPTECDNCSNCEIQGEIIDITIQAQKIFSCIYRMEERYGITLIAQVLMGSNSKRVRELGFDKLSTYSIMEQYTLKEIKELINLLVAEQYISLVGGRYPVVKLKNKAVNVLKGEEKVYRRSWKAKERKEENQALFDRLRNLRTRIAERENLPPYIIFHDSTLREMSQYCPQDRRAMLAITGVGEVKLSRYGEEFLAEIIDYLESVEDSDVSV